MIDEYGIEAVEKENWKKAKGVKAKRSSTNSALTPRDYSIKCDCLHKICIIKGYWIWWCSAHHQPLAWCDKARLKITFCGGLDELKKEQGID